MTANSVVIARVGAGMVPVHVKITYTDGSKEKINKPVDCWKDGKRTITLFFTGKKKVSGVILEDGYDADVDLSNNKL